MNKFLTYVHMKKEYKIPNSNLTKLSSELQFLASGGGPSHGTGENLEDPIEVDPW